MRGPALSCHLECHRAAAPTSDSPHCGAPARSDSRGAGRPKSECSAGQLRGELPIRGSQVRLLPGAPANQSLVEHLERVVTIMGNCVSRADLDSVARVHWRNTYARILCRYGGARWLSSGIIPSSVSPPQLS